MVLKYEEIWVVVREEGRSTGCGWPAPWKRDAPNYFSVSLESWIIEPARFIILIVVPNHFSTQTALQLSKRRNMPTRSDRATFHFKLAICRGLHERWDMSDTTCAVYASASSLFLFPVRFLCHNVEEAQKRKEYSSIINRPPPGVLPQRSGRRWK